MTTCGYSHIVLLGFLSSNGVIALILLKIELLIPSYDFGYSIHACFAYRSEIDCKYLVPFHLKKKTLRESRQFKISST